MQQQGLFFQNVIAIIWDFDKTLSPQYMQTPLFEAYGLDERRFWAEVNALPAYYARAGIHVEPDTCYLGHLLTYVQAGKMPGLSNAKLREIGAKIPFFPGIPELFDRIQAILMEPKYQEGDLRLEHYVVSTGLEELIRGSSIASKLAGVWASGFVECPALPGGDLSGRPEPGPISQIACLLDNTTKTRAIFEINKGVNRLDGVSVNDMIPEEDRRVPIRNMIYVADGPSDIPSFSVIRKHGGLAYAVYQPASRAQFEQVVKLLESGRVNGYGPAEYTAEGPTDMWLRMHVREIADRIMTDRKSALDRRVGRGPTHLGE